MRRTKVFTLLVIILLAAIPATAGAAERGRSASRSGLIPVWAFINAGAPVAHARVGVMTGGKPVRQVGGAVWTRTNGRGVALLDVRRVPRRFTVVVRGGRANGFRLSGPPRRVVSGYRHTAVVYVNPLTTLVAQLHAQRPRLSARRAQREVKRYFGVPQWADLVADLIPPLLCRKPVVTAGAPVGAAADKTQT
jgi:hypothetical protein